MESHKNLYLFREPLFLDHHLFIPIYYPDALTCGKADFNVDVTMNGNNWNSLNNLDGGINFYGKNLTLHGYNTGKLIAKLKTHKTLIN